MANTTPTPNTGLNQEVDYGKSTLFRFSLVHKPEVKKDSKATPIFSRPGNSNASRMISEGEESSEFLETVSDLIELNENLFTFSEWLASNNTDFDFAEVKGKLTDVAALNEEQENLVWDSLYHHYRAVNPDNISKKLVNLIRANAFLNAFNELLSSNPELTDFPSDEEKEKFIAISKGLISIPEDQIPEVEQPVLPVAPLFSPDQQLALKRKQLAAIGAYREKTLSVIADKFKEVNIEYEAEKNAAYNAAVAEHNKKVEQLLENRDLIEELSEKPISEIEGLELPEFTFTFPPFDTDYIKGKECFEDVGNAIDDFAANHDFCGKIEKVDNYLSKNIDDAKNTYNANLGLDIPKMIPFNEHEIVYDPSPLNNSFVVQVIKLLPNHDKLSLVFTHYSKTGASKIGKISGFIIPDGGSSIEITNSKKIRETEEYTSFVVAENSIEPSDDEFALNGTAFAENGELEQPFTVTLKKDFYVYGPQPVSQSSLLRASDEDGIPGSDKFPMYGIKKIGILDYLRVEQEICCYLPGEVSRIENIMAREFRKKLTRDLERQEITTEESEEREDEKTTDTASTDRYEMHKEISQMLAKEQSKQIGITAGMNASYSGFGATVGVNAGFNMNTSNSSSQTNGYNQAETIAKEVTQKATERLLKKVTYKRTAKMLREHEETNEHGFDNRNGSSHVVGIYRWVDKIYKNTVFNYGKRLQYDFMLPEPAKNFKYWMSKNNTISPTRPELPVYPGVLADKGSGFNWKDISEDNYAKVAAEYGADIEPYPTTKLSIGKSFSEIPKERMRGDKSEWDETIGGFKYELEIPDGYVCKECWGEYSHVVNFRTNKWPSEANIQIDVRNVAFKTPKDWFMTFKDDGTGQRHQFHEIGLTVHNFLPISVTIFKVGGFSLNVIAVCELSQDAINQWKQRTYTAIMAAYQKKLQAYKDALLAYNNAQDAKNAESQKQIDYNYNPGIGRIIEARELKRLCIELMCYQFNPKLEFSREGYIDDTGCNKSNSYILKLNSDLNEHARLVNFLEQAFEWNLISYQFFPYMYANRKLWETLIKQKSTSDPLFEAFLQSGMARLTLTVTPGFEKQVMFFLDKGTVPVSDDFIPGGNEDWYRSIVDMLKVDEKKPIGQSWETRVPTDLVILQSDAAPLNQTGLPCSSDCKPNQTDWLANGQSEMSGALTIDKGLVTEIKDALIEVITQVATIIGAGGSSGGTSTTATGIRFRRNPNLTIAHIGKVLQMDNTGSADIYQLSPEVGAVNGEWEIYFQNLVDIPNSYSIIFEIEGDEFEYFASQWRGNSDPAVSIEDEYTQMKAFFEGLSELENLAYNIADGKLTISETQTNPTRISTKLSKDIFKVVTTSAPVLPIAPTAFPLGKLLAISGDDAIISNQPVETYLITPGKTVTVNPEIFNSSTQLDISDNTDMEQLLSHIIVPSADGYVESFSRSLSDLGNGNIRYLRDQFLGIAIAATSTQVTVVKIPYVSLVAHIIRKGALAGMFGN